MHKKLAVPLIILIAIILIIVFGPTGAQEVGTTQETPTSEASSVTIEGGEEALFDVDEQKILRNERKFRLFKIDLTKASVDLDLIIGGGPSKDGIPPLDNPRYDPISQVDVQGDVVGLLLDIEGDVRFYPYSIMVWHEIVNDTIGGQEVSVTFCPLCGSAIVFDRNVNGELLDFGTSGFLYESNLVMYDRQTDSLWSQSQGRAIVGEKTGTQLSYVPFQLLTFAEVQEQYPQAQVLSEQTGHVRDYDFYPYGDYDENNDLFFSRFSVQDNRFEPKELFLIIPRDGIFYAVKQLDILAGEEATFTLKNEEEVVVENKEKGVIATVDGVQIPTFIGMWFSFATQHQDDGEVLVP